MIRSAQAMDLVDEDGDAVELVLLPPLSSPLKKSFPAGLPLKAGWR